MRLKNLFSLIAFLLAHHLFAQNIEPFALYSDSLFSSHPFTSFDTSNFRNTDLLLHKKMMGIHWQSFQGTSEDSTFYAHHRFQPILDARRIAIDSNQYPTYQGLKEREQWVLSNLNANPLTLCHFEYDVINDSLLIDSTVFLNSNGIFSYPVNTNPFLKETMFLASGNFDGLILNDSLAFIIPDTLIFSNVAVSITQLRIDLADGTGLRTINTNQPFSVFYTENQADSILTWQIQVDLSNGQTLYAKMGVRTKTNNCNPPSVSPGPWGGQDKLGFFGTIHWKYQFPTSLTQSWNGKKAEGNTYVYYRSDITSGEENKFRKPLIIVEGIDFGGTWPGDGLPPNTSTHMGDAGWPTMWDCDSDYPFKEFPDFLEDLHEQNYDIILLDFHDGVDYMQRNGMLLTSIIQEINDHKIGDEQIVILGASMGGQVARYALTYMENNDIDHCTSLFASLDSPWKGAHIPLSIQWFINTAAAWGDADGVRLKSRINSPAARQLLRFHYLANTGTKIYNGGQYERTINYSNGTELAPDPLYTSFQNDITNLGDYPKLVRNISLVNGNDVNDKTFPNDGQTYVNFDETIDCLTSLPGLLTGIYRMHIETKLYAVGASNGIIFIGDRPLEPKNKVKVFGASNLDNVPGSLRLDIEREVVPAIQNAIWNGIASNSGYLLGGSCQSWVAPTPSQRSSTFIPTASALNLNIPTLFNYTYTSLNTSNPSLSGDTHFDAYNAISISTGHVQGTVSNLDWLKNQVFAASVSYGDPGTGVLTKRWNLPIATVSILGLDVNGGGVLEMNSNNPIFDSNDDGLKEPVGGLAKISLGGACFNSTVMNINNGGQLSLGDPAASNLAYFYVREGGVLNVNQGGQVAINQGCKIVVENGGTLKVDGAINANEGSIIIKDGGNLIIDVNAQINLQQPSTELLIQGKLTVEDNATLTNIGFGKMVFDQQVLKPNGVLAFADFMEIGINAKIVLNGSSGTPPFTQDILEIRKPLYLIDGNNNTFREVNMNYGRVGLAGGALLYVYGKADFHHVTFDNSNSGRHDGVRLWNGSGQGVTFNGCTINYGKLGILADWIGGGPALQIYNCSFNDNLTGLKVNGGNVNLIGSDFSNNQHGFVGIALSGVTTIGGADFLAGSSGREGVSISTQNGAIINISNTLVKNYNNGNGLGLDLHGVDVNLTCSNILNNNVGIDLWDGILYINNEAGNQFINNIVGIQYSGQSNETGVYLLEGENKFSLGTNGTWYIQGVTQGGGLLSNYFNSTTIDANLNEMPLVHSSSTGAVIPARFGINFSTSALGIDIANNFQNNTSCGNPLFEPGHPYLVPINLTSGDGGDYEGGSFKNALILAVENITFSENELDDMAALSDLLDLLEANILNQDGSYLELRHMAIGAAMSSLENCIQFESIPHAEGAMAVHQDVQRFIDVLAYELDSLDPLDSADHAGFFRYTLNKTQVYRVAGNYSQALNLLSNNSSWTFSNRQSMRAQYWDCICDAESDLYQGIIGVEDFLIIKDQCDVTFQGFNYKRFMSQSNEELGISVSPDERIIKVFPKPVNEILTVQIEEGFLGNVEYSIRNSAGVLNQKGTMEWKGLSQEQLNVQGLKPGVYFISFRIDEHEIQTLKIVKK